MVSWFVWFGLSFKLFGWFGFRWFGLVLPELNRIEPLPIPNENQVEILGYVVLEDGVSVDLSKVQMVLGSANIEFGMRCLVHLGICKFLLQFHQGLFEEYNAYN